MRYRDFKGVYKGQKIIVCGCGESASLIGDHHYKAITIGVNDISRLFKPDYLVILDPPCDANSDRWPWIKNAKAAYCFTQLRDLDVAPKIIPITLGRFEGTDFESPAVDYTTNSPYVACIIAAYMGASEIGLLGVDFTDHHFFEQSGKHPITDQLPQIRKQYSNLASVLACTGSKLISLSPTSLLGLPFTDIKEFLP